MMDYYTHGELDWQQKALDTLQDILPSLWLGPKHPILPSVWRSAPKGLQINLQRNAMALPDITTESTGQTNVPVYCSALDFCPSCKSTIAELCHTNELVTY